MTAIAPERTTPYPAGACGASTGESTALTRHWQPRYWPTWIFLAWLKATAALPWQTAIALHRRIGRGLWHVMRGRRRIVLRNLELCFPELGAAELAALARRHFENVGASIAEIALAWFRAPTRRQPPVCVEGLEHIAAAQAHGKGVILYSGHFTTLEFCVQLLKAATPSLTFMFRPRHNALLNAAQSRGRLRTAALSFANTDVRGMLRILARNAVVWYAPDQAHAGNGAVLLPFFGEPAMTNTAAARLARLSGAAVVPFFFCRLPGEAGYLLRFEAAVDDLPSGDPTAGTARLVGVLERFVRACPEQYLWTHRKFKGRGAGLPDAYARAAK